METTKIKDQNNLYLLTKTTKKKKKKQKNKDHNHLFYTLILCRKVNQIITCISCLITRNSKIVFNSSYSTKKVWFNQSKLSTYLGNMTLINTVTALIA